MWSVGDYPLGIWIFFLLQYSDTVLHLWSSLLGEGQPPGDKTVYIIYKINNWVRV